MGKRKTHEEYVEEVFLIDPNIEVVGVYANAATKILHRCKIDGHEWSVTPNNILSGHGCPKCGNKSISRKLLKTHDKYVADVRRVNPNIEVLGIYVNSSTNILHHCKIDNYEWMARPANILTGYGCPKCSGMVKNTHKEYVDRLKTINPNIEILGEYVSLHTKILHKCRIDGYEWYATPSHILGGTGCPICGRKSQAQKRRKTHQEYVNQVSIINPNIDVIDKYINNQTKILHKCKLCKNEWKITPHNILNGQGCPKCNISHGENDIEKYLNQHNISYTCQYKFDDCCNEKALPFDFYLPEYNVCVEYDGIQHFEPTDFAGRGELWANQKFKQIQYNDEIKNKYCSKNNITLLRIRYDEDIEYVLNKFFDKQNIMICR